MQYLTIIGLSLATTTFVVGLVADITLNRTLFRIKNALSVASAPMECLISLLYWGLRAVWLPYLPFILRGLAEGTVLDRSKTRSSRLAASSTLPHRYLLPRGAFPEPRDRPAILLASVHDCICSSASLERNNSFWILVLD